MTTNEALDSIEQSTKDLRQMYGNGELWEEDEKAIVVLAGVMDDLAAGYSDAAALVLQLSN